MSLGTAALAAVLAQLVEPLLGARALVAAFASVLAAALVVGLSARRPTLSACCLALACALLATRPCVPPVGENEVVALAGSDGRGSAAATIRARVIEIVPSPRGGARWLIEAIAFDDDGARPLAGRALLYVHMHAPEVAVGTLVAFTGRFRRITGFGNPGELDWAGWNARRGVFVSATVWDGGDLRILPTRGQSPRDRFAALRERITRAAVDGHGRGGVLTAALVTGERRLLDEADARAVNAAGLAHVLAISGLNLSFVGGAVTLVCARLLLRTRAARAGVDTLRGAIVAGLVATLGYAAISGGGVSVTRAALMSVAVASALWNGATGTAVGGLAAAALAISLGMPGVAREAGFQLSFAAVAAILLYTSRPRVAGQARPGAVRSALELSLLCWVVSTPIVAHHFGRVALYGAPATLLTAPLGSAIVGAGLAGAAAVACGLPQLAAPAFAVAGWASEAFLTASAWIAALPFAELKVVSPGPLLTAALAILPCVRLLRREVAARCGAAIAVLAIVLVADAYHERYRADALDVHVLSVGQGDATVLRLPGGHVALVDGGPPGRGAMIVVPYLRRLHIARIDTVIVTHAQDDHYGGMQEILDVVEVGELWSSVGRCDVARFAELRALAASRGVRLVDVGSETLPEREGPGWRLTALWPRDGDGECDENDRSLATVVEYAGRRMLFAGDIEARAEAGLVRSAGVRLDVDLLTAPHHGSRTSSSPAFVAATSPSWVVASAGRDNRYGFPRAETVARYRDAGATFLTTAEVGAVHARIDENGRITVEAGLGKRRRLSHSLPR